jgi:prepilin-type N-terminal cleavage/methylation domain-containing protein
MTVCKSATSRESTTLRPARPQRGFTLVELLTVTGIVAITAAVALPNIAGYVRANRIRAGQELVAGALRKARDMAIGQNTQQGVTFITQDNNTFWIHVEDSIAGVTDGDVGFTRQGINFNSPNPILSTQFDLPDNVEFAADGADCPGVPGYAANQPAIRFDHYGVASVPGAATAVVLSGGSVASPFTYLSADGDRGVCLIDRQTGLRRWLRLSAGGRVLRLQ